MFILKKEHQPGVYVPHKALLLVLNNAMAFVYAYFFSDFLCFDMSLLLFTD